jgi:hypothetical protein
MTESGWIGVDLDGTLAEYHGWNGENNIGSPIPLMIERVKNWIANGITVKIFTARVCINGAYSLESKKFADTKFSNDQEKMIKEWCKKYIGQELEVTNKKDFSMIELWDDRCRQVIMNTGQLIK